MDERTHLTVVSRDSLAEAGLVVDDAESPVRACVDCRYFLPYEKCGARGNIDVQVHQINLNCDCPHWRAKELVRQGSRAIGRASLTLSIIAFVLSLVVVITQIVRISP